MQAKEEYETSLKEDSGAAVHVELPHLEEVEISEDKNLKEKVLIVFFTLMNVQKVSIIDHH